LAVARWLPDALQAGPRAFEGAVDRVDGRVEHVGDLVGVKAEDVAQDDDGELARRQGLQGGHECQRDGLGLLVPGFGAERPFDGTLAEDIGIRSSHTTSPSLVGSGG
jgi:hypothetical protein